MVTPINNSSSTVLLSAVTQQQSDFSLYLAAQLRHQDPFSPISTTSILQQQLAASQIQTGLLGNLSLASISNLSTLGLLFNISPSIGKTAQYQDTGLNLVNGQGTITYKLDSQATKLTIDIFNASGTRITSSAITQLGQSAPKLKGDNTFALNTQNTALNGSFTYNITAYDSNNKILPATPFATSQIQSSILNQGVVFVKMSNSKVVDTAHVLQIS